MNGAYTAERSGEAGAMCRLQVKLRLLSPAFPGDAEQSACWRTPPIKALLRHWWRFAWSEAQDYRDDLRALRDAEDALFGAASGEGGRRSRLRLRLEEWEHGRLSTDWQKKARSDHPYLGFGVLTRQPQRSAAGPDRMAAAIDAQEAADLRLAYPRDAGPLLLRALELMDQYGTLGGRSRNGWGSLALTVDEGGRLTTSNGPPLRDWRRCLDRDWPHALGRDARAPLIWHTEPGKDWSAVMKCLAQVKADLRKEFPFNAHSGSTPQPRHWLAYPVTKHSVDAWKGLRLPNSLRFKLREDSDGQLRGVVFHVPCLPPEQFRPERDEIERVWTEVHASLDERADLSRADEA
jgi:CRISPR-associated protein Cmr1